MPTDFNAQSKTLRNLALSANKQAAWGGTLADLALTRRQRFDGSAVLDYTSTRRDDSKYSGRGTFFTTNGQVTGWDTKISSVKCELSDWLAGWLAAMAFGSDVVTGEASPYTHTCAYDETTRTAVATTAYVEDTDDVHTKIPDLALNDFTLTISEIGAIMAEFNLVGTGKIVASSMAALPALADETYLLGSDCVLTRGPAGALVSLLGRHMNSTFKWDNQLVPHKAPGLGLTAGFIRKGLPKFSLQTTIASKEADDVWTDFVNDAESKLIYTINSGAAAQLILTVSAAHLKSTKLGFDNDMTIWQLEYDETTSFKQGAVLPVSVQVINAVPAYLVAA